MRTSGKREKLGGTGRGRKRKRKRKGAEGKDEKCRGIEVVVALENRRREHM